jgi:hypothetical protein
MEDKNVLFFHYNDKSIESDVLFSSSFDQVISDDLDNITDDESQHCYFLEGSVNLII